MIGRVYPRVCGGTVSAPPAPPCWDGLSPRVRGNPASRPATTPAPRSIPACAGEPPCGRCAQSRHRVYPRVCGGTCPACWDGPGRSGLSPRVRGNRRGGVVALSGPGLSPRVRGNHALPFPRERQCRSIPACAGEPSPLPPLVAAWSVYPRVCGGTFAGPGVSIAHEGLSPRVRGNLGGADGHHRRAGSIPACAGEPYRGVLPPE